MENTIKENITLGLEFLLKIFSFILLSRFVFLNYLPLTGNGFISSGFLQFSFLFFNISLFLLSFVLLLGFLVFFIRRGGLDFYMFAVPFLFIFLESIVYYFNINEVFINTIYFAKIISIIVALIYFTFLNYRYAVKEHIKSYYLYVGVGLVFFSFSGLLYEMSNASAQNIYKVLTFQSHSLLLFSSVFIIIEIYKKLNYGIINKSRFLISILPLVLTTIILFVRSFQLDTYSVLFENNLYINTYFPDYFYFIFFCVILFYVLYNYFSKQVKDYLPSVVFLLSFSLYTKDRIDPLLILLFLGVSQFYLLLNKNRINLISKASSTFK